MVRVRLLSTASTASPMLVNRCRAGWWRLRVGQAQQETVVKLLGISPPSADRRQAQPGHCYAIFEKKNLSDGSSEPTA